MASETKTRGPLVFTYVRPTQSEICVPRCKVFENKCWRRTSWRTTEENCQILKKGPKLTEMKKFIGCHFTWCKVFCSFSVIQSWSRSCFIFKIKWTKQIGVEFTVLGLIAPVLPCVTDGPEPKMATKPIADSSKISGWSYAASLVIMIGMQKLEKINAAWRRFPARLLRRGKPS